MLFLDIAFVDLGRGGKPCAKRMTRALEGALDLVERLVQERSEFVECSNITGDDPFSC